MVHAADLRMTCMRSQADWIRCMPEAMEMARLRASPQPCPSPLSVLMQQTWMPRASKRGCQRRSAAELPSVLLLLHTASSSGRCVCRLMPRRHSSKVSAALNTFKAMLTSGRPSAGGSTLHVPQTRASSCCMGPAAAGPLLRTLSLPAGVPV